GYIARMTAATNVCHHRGPVGHAQLFKRVLSRARRFPTREDQTPASGLETGLAWLHVVKVRRMRVASVTSAAERVMGSSVGPSYRVRHEVSRITISRGEVQRDAAGGMAGGGSGENGGRSDSASGRRCPLLAEFGSERRDTLGTVHPHRQQQPA